MSEQSPKEIIAAALACALGWSGEVPPSIQAVWDGQADAVLAALHEAEYSVVKIVECIGPVEVSS